MSQYSNFNNVFVLYYQLPFFIIKTKLEKNVKKFFLILNKHIIELYKSN